MKVVTKLMVRISFLTDVDVAYRMVTTSRRQFALYPHHVTTIQLPVFATAGLSAAVLPNPTMSNDYIEIAYDVLIAPE